MENRREIGVENYKYRKRPGKVVDVAICKRELEDYDVLEQITHMNYEALKENVEHFEASIEHAIEEGEKSVLTALKSVYANLGRVVIIGAVSFGIGAGSAKIEANAYGKINSSVAIEKDMFATKVISKSIKDVVNAVIPATNTSSPAYESVRGAATIYADFFDGDTTASGKIFRQSEVSFAVPIGSEWAPKVINGKRKIMQLKVTNLDNGKYIEGSALDVGDFGYTKRGAPNKYIHIDDKVRVLDISEKAALLLGGITKKQYNSGEDILTHLHVEVVALGYR